MFDSVLEGLYEVRARVINGCTECDCLCDELDDATDGEWQGVDLKPAFATFPEFSGAYNYPISTGKQEDYVFGWDFPQRIALLDHCIRYFEEN